jgi:hypothetical protein
VRPCILKDHYRGFGGTFWFHLQVKRISRTWKKVVLINGRRLRMGAVGGPIGDILRSERSAVGRCKGRGNLWDEGMKLRQEMRN